MIQKAVRPTSLLQYTLYTAAHELNPLLENLFVSNKLNDFQGKRALVTGAGDGIGEMLAKNIAGAGLSVVVQDIRLDAAERVAQEIGDAATPIALMSRPRRCMSAAETIARDGLLNLLWVNAGVGVGASILKGRPNAIEWAVGVNVLGVVWTTQALFLSDASATGPRHWLHCVVCSIKKG